MELWGVTEKDMPQSKIMALGAQIGFRRSKAFPFAWINQLVPYQTHAESVEESCQEGMLHRYYRYRNKLNRESYGRWLGLRGRASVLANLPDQGGITYLIK